MISRRALTLTLACSLAFTTADAGKKFKQGSKTKIVTGFAIAAGLTALAKGYFSGRGSALADSEKTFAAGIGILTGVGCALFEHYMQKTVPHGNTLLPLIAFCSWHSERELRDQALNYSALSGSGNWNAARKASWASYLIYYGARYADDD
jgi:hypothetical protein